MSQGRLGVANVRNLAVSCDDCVKKKIFRCVMIRSKIDILREMLNWV